MKDDRLLQEVTFDYAGRSSTYAASVLPPEAGDLKLEVLALDAANANFGRVAQSLRVVEP